MPDLDVALAELEQIAEAAHFEAHPYEDYGLVEHVANLWTYSRVLRGLLVNHPELNAEATALTQTPAELDARGV